MGVIHRQKRIYRSIEYFLLLSFFVATLLVPVAIINKIFFMLLIFFMCIKVLSGKFFLIPTFSPIVISLIFIYGFLVSLCKHNMDSELAVQFLMTTATLFLIYLICDRQLNITSIVKWSGLILGLTSFFLFIIFSEYVSFFDSVQIESVFKEYSSGVFGERSFTDDAVLMFHFGSVPFIFIPACIYLKEYMESRKTKNILIVFLLIIVMVMSSSRALIVAFIFSSSVIIYLNLRGVSKAVSLVMSVVASVVAVWYVLINTTALSLDEPSNSIKVGHFTSFFDALEPSGLLIGNGLASFYYSTGLGREVAHTEITLLDMFRYFGFFLTVLLYAALLFPVLNVKNYRCAGIEVFVIFGSYLLLSLSNPTLFNSYGLLVVLWYWSEIINSK